jgi:hypothetical protein
MSIQENRNYVFILGPHKSGSSLLRNLLDGHPDVFAIPIETHYFSISQRFWINYFLWAERPRVKKTDPESFVKHIHTYSDVSAKYRDIERSDFIQPEKFRSYLFEHWPDAGNTKDEIINYFDAVYYSIHSTPIDKNLVVAEKSVSNAENAIRLQKLFPNAKFIHLVRNPYDNLLSFRNYRRKQKSKFPSLRDLVESLKVNYYYLYKNQELIDNYYVLKYEDLVTDTNNHMQAISKFLEIPFNDTLLMPTTNGAPWEGNSSQDKRFTGISKERIGHIDKQITKVEVEIINRLFDFILDDFGYQRMQKKGSFFAFGKNEKFKTYIYNRLYYYFS